MKPILVRHLLIALTSTVCEYSLISSANKRQRQYPRQYRIQLICITSIQYQTSLHRFNSSPVCCKTCHFISSNKIQNGNPLGIVRTKCPNEKC